MNKNQSTLYIIYIDLIIDYCFCPSRKYCRWYSMVARGGTQFEMFGTLWFSFSWQTYSMVRYGMVYVDDKHKITEAVNFEFVKSAIEM